MDIYDIFKDAISIAQKADNIELYYKLLDLSAQTIELQKAREIEEDSEQLTEGYLIKKVE